MSRETESEERRREILQILAADSDYSVNDNLIQRLLAERGVGVSLATVRNDITWLEAKNLVTVQELPMCQIVTARRAGLEIAQGLNVLPGIARLAAE